YDRAAFILQSCTSHRCRFVRLYARYLAGEKRKDEKAPNAAAGNPLDGSGPLETNHEMAAILQELSTVPAADLDGFELYLFGLVYHQQGLADEARRVLLASVTKFPCNWSAWLALEKCIPTAKALDALIPVLPKSFVTEFFLTHMHVNMQTLPKKSDVHCQALREQFPQCAFLQSLSAMAHYHAREFEEADALFDHLFRRDPYRLDQVDVYSNILYVMENRPKLAYLAHHCTNVDRFRPETCCVIGNYYGLRGEHEKAVVYFQRALKLNRNYLSAWTLMGHEYVELKNTAAAIEAYRRAIDVDRRDHRAWSGLGQAYEFLKMPHYALFYYQKAASLRPFDTRLWTVLAGCYELCHRYKEAISCYNRALLESENEPLTLSQLAKLYDKLHKHKEAVHHYELAIKSYPLDEPKSEEYIEACLYLARYEQSRANLSVASRYLQLVIDHGGM
ncbi:Anaphase-promoting complex subunit 8, partial [Dimargaris xerosporica]